MSGNRNGNGNWKWGGNWTENVIGNRNGSVNGMRMEIGMRNGI